MPSLESPAPPLLINPPAFVEVTATGLIFRDGEPPTYQQWAELGKPLLQVGRCFSWLIGDWINYGANKWGEKYTEAIEKTGIDYGTLANWALVAKKVPFSSRYENLSHTHHMRVAKLEPKEQARWLGKVSAALDKGDCVGERRLAKSIKEGRLLTEAECQVAVEHNGIENHIPFVNRLVAWWRKKKEGGWLEEATADQKQAIRDDLQRVVDIYNELEAAPN